MLIIVGSRREGNSYNLAMKVKETLAGERVFSEIITPGNERIHLCTGCMDCEETGVCDFKDDMEKNIEKILNEDVIMFITPTRWNLLSGDLKIFMDRLNPLYSRKLLKGKKAIIVAIGAKSKDEYSANQAISSLRSFVESADMTCALTQEFDECLDFKDILSKTEEVDNFLESVKKIAKEN